ncbi:MULTISPECIES: 3-deoxy-D-manno-octulosonic acid transferase [Sphingobacterium]|uniref:3-deoxy-D-manno-octulosonic acid transferase n=1 Tax=Sphingobacterium cellulitidis TaxID=1768011 RepID=A0A8H9FZJ8_9SPHI|nr:glycosyltransferase N-terminal domain-containing protein [Sphingobacterium soli]MBA8987477.1 3-deoxy-D-manno-octulosonic-acid transferase [Sphingobacterium soli]GGE24524.1 3-deoxy-D-manno-octulosonic acid transferase [Sphingobacterium soli]
MMRFLYDLGILIYGLLLRVFALFNAKAKLLLNGRKDLLQRIEQTVEKDQEYIWFHFASLGEFEQGRAVMEQIKIRYPNEKIIVTFFSPSGYEIRKNTALADYVFYLPADTPRNSRRFLDLINPKFAVFTKYEYWYHYFKELNKRKIRLLMISAIFREDQVFFKQYGGFFRSILKNVSFFFTQNNESVHMLKWIGITNAGLAGDTRFDRVVELPKQHKDIPEVQRFVGKDSVLVAGSTWQPDEILLKDLLEKNKDLKAIIAPHEIHQEHIDQILKLFPHALLFSKFNTYTDQQIAASRQLIIDNIGMLSSLYYYGRIAYIGGGFGVGIHNTLEAATYGMPVIFGPKYEKFQEAIDLLEIGAGFSIANEKELNEVYQALSNSEKLLKASLAAKNYVQQRSGATQIIMKYLETEKLLNKV